MKDYTHIYGFTDIFHIGILFILSEQNQQKFSCLNFNVILIYIFNHIIRCLENM